MDFQKEREAFLKWHYQAYLLENPEIDVKNAQYIYDYAHKNALCAQLRESQFTVWQAAKAQAVPAGFVLMPIKPTETMVMAVVKEHEGDAFLPYSLYDAYVKQAMIEAQEPSKAQAVLEIKPSRHVTLTCAQLREAFMFGAPDKDDQEQLETEMTIQWSDEGHSGAGYYCYYADYPEEGAIKLGETQEPAND